VQSIDFEEQVGWFSEQNEVYTGVVFIFEVTTKKLLLSFVNPSLPVIIPLHTMGFERLYLYHKISLSDQMNDGMHIVPRVFK
jgi:hypothetical protein